MSLHNISQKIITTNPDQLLYTNTVAEVAHDIESHLGDSGADQAQYERWEQMLTPEKIIQFRVDWKNDKGEQEMNWGYRVQHSSARGPYKGGLRFDPSVSIDVLKFLALEQTFKNALTGLPLGSGKGGSDFNLKGKSDAEIKRFSQAFIRALYPYIGKGVDVPAGDIGVGGREISYMVEEAQLMSGQEVIQTLTGKSINQHGSYGRTEATGYGVLYLLQHILASIGESVQAKRVAISGSGNVATHAALKATELGGRVQALSDRRGYVYKELGFDHKDLVRIIEHQTARKALGEIEIEGAVYRTGSLWQEVRAHIYLPCATENEVNEQDAQAMVENKALVLAEGANMPCTPEAVKILQQSDTIFVPAKAANAGGVAVSGLEMEQNDLGVQWSSKEVDAKLQVIMKNIFETISKYGATTDGHVDYLRGANIGGYVSVDEAMKQL